MKREGNTVITKKGIVYSIVPDDEKANVLKFLNDKNELIASYDYKENLISAPDLSNIVHVPKVKDDVPEGLYFEENGEVYPFTGKGLMIINKKYFCFPFSNDLYEKAEQELKKTKKYSFQNSDYIKALCAVAVKELAKKKKRGGGGEKKTTLPTRQQIPIMLIPILTPTIISD